MSRLLRIALIVGLPLVAASTSANGFGQLKAKQQRSSTQPRLLLVFEVTGELRPETIYRGTRRPIVSLSEILSEQALRRELGIGEDDAAKIDKILTSYRTRGRKLQDKIAPADVQVFLDKISQLEAALRKELLELLTARQRARAEELIFRIECRNRGLLNYCESLFEDDWEGNPRALFAWREKSREAAKELRRSMMVERVRAVDRLLMPLSAQQKARLKRSLGTNYCYGRFPNIDLLLRQLEPNTANISGDIDDVVRFISFPRAFRLTAAGSLVSSSGKSDRFPALLAFLVDEEIGVALQLTDSQYDIVESAKADWTALVNRQTEEITRLYQSRSVGGNIDIARGLADSLRVEKRRREAALERQLLGMLTKPQKTTFERLAILAGVERHGLLTMLTESPLRRELNLSESQCKRLASAAAEARAQLLKRCHRLQQSAEADVLRGLPAALQEKMARRRGKPPTAYMGGIDVLLADMEERYSPGLQSR